MSGARILPLFEAKEPIQNEESYDSRIYRLYEDNFSLANTFEIRKGDLVAGQVFFGQSSKDKVRLVVSNDYTRLIVEKNGSLYLNKEMSAIKYICEGVHEKYSKIAALCCAPNRTFIWIV